MTLREFGTKSFAEAVEPAIELADGFPIDELRVSSLQRSLKYIMKWPASRQVFLPNGRAAARGRDLPPAGVGAHAALHGGSREEGLGRRAPAAEKAIDAVRDYFYRGEIARKIDEFSKQNGGFLRYEDMAAFRLSPEAPVSTTFHGYTVYKPGFWSQGPTMIEALNILNGFDLGALRLNSAEYIHTLVEALKLAYADRDTYYGDPKFTQIPADRLLSQEYADERRKLIGAEASQEFRPGQIGPHPPLHPSRSEIARYKIDDALAAKDTTCVDAIDKNGVAFSATPSGAWMPSYIAGDTGIPLTQRAQSFLLVPGHPNELAGGKRPRVTLSPTLATRGDNTVIALSTPGGDNQEQALIQVLFNAIEFGLNAENAVETPRFQTRHLVASFDNHAMSPGDLLLDERTPPAVVAELQKRKHHVETRPPFDSGAAPVDDPAESQRHDRGRIRPVLLPRRARMVGPLFDEPSAFDRDGLAARLRALAAEGVYIGGSSWKYEGWLGQIYTPRPLSFARPFLAPALRSRVPARVRRNVSHGVRRFRLLPVPQRGFLAQAVSPDARKLPLRLQSAGTDHLQGVSVACTLRPAGRARRTRPSSTAARSAKCFCGR